MTSLLASRKLRAGLALGLAAAWFGLLLLPAITLDTGWGSYPVTLTGLSVLASGWKALVFGQVAWFANFFLMITLILLTLERSHPSWLRVTCILLILCSLSAFRNDIIANAGFYLWSGVNLAAALAAFLFSTNRLMGADDSI